MNAMGRECDVVGLDILKLDVVDIPIRIVTLRSIGGRPALFQYVPEITGSYFK